MNDEFAPDPDEVLEQYEKMAEALAAHRQQADFHLAMAVRIREGMDSLAQAELSGLVEAMQVAQDAWLAWEER